MQVMKYSIWANFESNFNGIERDFKTTRVIFQKLQF